MASLISRLVPRHGTFEGSTVIFAVAVGLLLLIVGYPLLWLLMAAFGVPADFQLGYLARVYTRSQNFKPLINTLILALGSGVMSVLLGVPLAWATARADVPLRRTIQLFALEHRGSAPGAVPSEARPGQNKTPPQGVTAIKLARG